MLTGSNPQEAFQRGHETWRRRLRFIAGFVIGLVAGYGLVLSGWIAITNVVAVRDVAGAASMQVAFFYAPLGGLICALALGIWLQRRGGSGRAPPRS